LGDDDEDDEEDGEDDVDDDDDDDDEEDEEDEDDVADEIEDDLLFGDSRALFEVTKGELILFGLGGICSPLPLDITLTLVGSLVEKDNDDGSIDLILCLLLVLLLLIVEVSLRAFNFLFIKLGGIGGLELSTL